MMTPNGNIFRVTARCCPFVMGIQCSPDSGFPSQRPGMQSFDIFFDLRQQTAEQTIERPVISDATALIMTSQ